MNWLDVFLFRSSKSHGSTKTCKMWIWCHTSPLGSQQKHLNFKVNETVFNHAVSSQDYSLWSSFMIWNSGDTVLSRWVSLSTVKRVLNEAITLKQHQIQTWNTKALLFQDKYYYLWKLKVLDIKIIFIFQ